MSVWSLKIIITILILSAGTNSQLTQDNEEVNNKTSINQIGGTFDPSKVLEDQYV